MNQLCASRKLFTNSSGYRAGAPGSSRGRRWARLSGAVAASAAILGVFGLPGPVALAGSSPVLTWTKQNPASSPPALANAPMAYDAATGTAVLFGSDHQIPLGLGLADTWAWDGSAWTEQSPATSPSARSFASMAYDAATGTAVLFGGETEPGDNNSADTWTWDGSAWTEQSPATSPPARSAASLAYDAATGAAVLFGGTGGIPGHPTFLRGTWTWSAG